MDGQKSSSRRENSEERHLDDSSVKESLYREIDNPKESEREKLRDTSKHRSKDTKRSQREEKDHRSRDKDRSKTTENLKEREKEEKDSDKVRISSKEKKKEDREDHKKESSKDDLLKKDYDHKKDRSKDDVLKKDYDKDRHREDHDKVRDKRDRGKERGREREKEVERERDGGREKERAKEKSKAREKEREKEKPKDRDKTKARERDEDKERHGDRKKERENEKSRTIDEKEKSKEKNREKEREMDQGKGKSKDREKKDRRNRDDDHYLSEDGEVEDKGRMNDHEIGDKVVSRRGKASPDEEERGIIKQGNYVEDVSAPSQSTAELGERIVRLKEERLKKKPDGASEILSWVNKSRKIEEKQNAEKEKALQRSKIFEEQDMVDEDDNVDEVAGRQNANALAGAKVLHGLDKVIEGGSVVLTLKDQDILANGDINEEMDMLENIDIGEQKRRDEAYKAAKKKTGIYDDKFSDEFASEKKILPQYDDPAAEEGVTLDANGRFTGEAEKKLEELRRRLEGASVKHQVEDLASSAKISSDYYTPEEMLQFKKPKKKKSLRKREKLDIDALEAEAISAGMGAGDLGSRNDSKRQAAREEQEKAEAERRRDAYRAAYAKAEEASRALRMEQALIAQRAEENTEVFADDAEDLQKSLGRARKLALKKQTEEAVAGPEAIARLASSATSSQLADGQNSAPGESSENKVVFTEMEEFVWGLQLDEEPQKPSHDDVFMEEDEAPKASEKEAKDEVDDRTVVKDLGKDETSKDENEEKIVPDETIHEAPVGKGLSGVLKLLNERGALKETVEWGGRNMDKKKSKLVGIYDEAGAKEIRLERTDEYGRILTPKEAFRLLSHKFHGKGPGKMKQEKRMKQYHDELKLKQTTSSDTTPQSVERMREAQAKLKTPYLVLSGHVKPGQTSDPKSGFATVEKDIPGSLTPMLGDKKVEHFLGIKRKAEGGSSSGIPKRPKT